MGFGAEKMSSREPPTDKERERRFKIWGTLVQYAIDFEGGEEMGFGADKMMKKLKLIELKFADKFREVLLPTGMCKDGIQPMEVTKLAEHWALATAKVEEGGVDSFTKRMAGVEPKSVLENLEVLDVAGLLKKSGAELESMEVWSQ